MSWKDQLRDASFRGVAFKVPDLEVAIGRRLAVFEYPQREDPHVEDLGRRASRHDIQAYVVGPDYMAARDELIKALRAAGPGTLVHPTLGSLTVAVEDARVRESAQEGGAAFFQISFIETSTATPPDVATDTGTAVDDAADDADAAADEAFTDSFDVASLPDQVATAAEAAVDRFADFIEPIAGTLTAATDALFDMSRRLAAVRSKVFSLVRAPADLSLAVRGALGSLRSLASTPSAAFKAMIQASAYTAPAVRPGPTKSRQTMTANAAALQKLVRRAAIVEAAQAATEIEFEAYQEAVAVRDQLADAIDALAVEAADAGEDDAWSALEQLRLAVVRDITARGGSLERLYSFTPRLTVPVLLLAHQLYGDATRADEIVARNGVRHPGFTVGGGALEVLSDG